MEQALAEEVSYWGQEKGHGRGTDKKRIGCGSEGRMVM